MSARDVRPGRAEAAIAHYRERRGPYPPAAADAIAASSAVESKLMPELGHGRDGESEHGSSDAPAGIPTGARRVKWIRYVAAGAVGAIGIAVLDPTTPLWRIWIAWMCFVVAGGLLWADE